MRKLAALLVALLLAGPALAQPAQPMPNPPHPRGYVQAPPQVTAALHVAAKDRHGLRMAQLPKATPATFDCRALGWTLPINDQGDCGSCYGVSAYDGCSAAMAKAGKFKNDGSQRLSSQYGLDCGTFQGGCNGGDEAQVIDDVKRHGAPLTSDYGQYTARPGRCKNTASMPFFTIQDWGYCKGDQGQGIASVQEIKNAMVQYGPISVAFDASGCDGYTGGVMSGSGRNVDHAVLCIGWDDSKGAFLGQNQWGTSWGESGFFWIKYGSYSWGTEAIWMTVAAAPTPPVPPVPPVPPTPPIPPTPPVPPAPGSTYTLKTAPDGTLTFTPAKPSGLTEADLAVLNAAKTAADGAAKAIDAILQKYSTPAPAPLPADKPEPPLPGKGALLQEDYNRLHYDSIRDGVPLLVFVGQPVRYHLRGVNAMRWDDFAAGPCVVVGVPRAGALWRVDLHGEPSDASILAVACPT